MAKLNDCGCCQGVAPRTPASVENLPGRDTLAYRVGTHGRFMASMRAHMVQHEALADLTTRDTSDPSIALMDAWATALDILTFYQERIANEGYLRTATERRSLLELARGVGYELRPGVAAGTYLAFELETAPTAPERVMLPVGTRAQTVPGQDESPQTFETVEAIEGRPEWNRFRAKATTPMLPDMRSTSLYLEGVTTPLKPGDCLLIVGREREADPTSERWDFRIVTNVDADPVTNVTCVRWDEPLGWSGRYASVHPAELKPRAYAFHQRASLFGHNALEWQLLADEVRADYGDKSLPEWPGFGITIAAEPLAPSATGVGLCGEYFASRDLTNLVGVRIDPQVCFDWSASGPGEAGAPAFGKPPVVGVGKDRFSVRWTGQVLPEFTDTYTFHTLSDDGVRLWIDGKLLIDNWAAHSLAHNRGQITLEAGRKYDIRLEYYEKSGVARIELHWSRKQANEDLPIPPDRLYPALVVYLDAAYPAILPDSWVVVSTASYREAYWVQSAAEAGRKGYGLSGRVTRLVLQGENLYEQFNSALRDAVVFAGSEEQTIAEAPDTSDVPQGATSIDVQGDASGLPVGRTLVVAGQSPDGKAVSEVVVLKVVECGGSRLVLDGMLFNSYRRDSVVVYANVARATHGESKSEVLGSGDSSRPFQALTLKQSPLTYTGTGAVASGAISTLAVRVDGVLWREVPSLYGLGGRDRAYVSRIGDDGKVTVRFGDGETGARLPTGAENVEATYRVGTGLAGIVRPKQISLLLSRPLGVRAVTNPMVPAGAKDPETRDQARYNAPFTVLTLDRVVSLQDYEDFARSFGGIAKAQARWLWDGERRIVHLTVAPAGGVDAPGDADTLDDLREAIAAACDPTQRFRVDWYAAIAFGVRIGVRRDDRYLPEPVQTAVVSKLKQRYGFDERQFGQSVTRGELYAAVQGVEGVVYVDVDRLRYVQTVTRRHYVMPLVASRIGGVVRKPTLPALIPAVAGSRQGAKVTFLPARVARWHSGTVEPAELLTLGANPGDLEVTWI